MKSRTRFMVHTYEPWFVVHGSWFILFGNAGYEPWFILLVWTMNHGSYFWYGPWGGIRLWREESKKNQESRIKRIMILLILKFSESPKNQSEESKRRIKKNQRINGKTHWFFVWFSNFLKSRRIKAKNQSEESRRIKRIKESRIFDSFDSAKKSENQWFFSS